MSGGSLEYVYCKVHNAVTDITAQAKTPLHRAFATHLVKVADALHDLEWVLSGDYGPGDEVASIEACLQEGAEFAVLIDDARKAHKALGDYLAQKEQS